MSDRDYLSGLVVGLLLGFVLGFIVTGRLVATGVIVFTLKGA